MKKFILCIICICTFNTVFAQDFRPIVIPPYAGFDEILAKDKEHFSVMVGLLKTADLPELQSSKSSFTLFAPTNEAFNNMPKGFIENAQKDKALAQKFIRAHLLKGKVLFAQVFNGSVGGGKVTKVFYSLNNEKIEIQCDDHPMSMEKEHHPLINQKAKTIYSDVEGKYNVIQVLDGVLYN
ncbi:hypothetical protein C3K47_03495 [Solitalea longa]|uniref:FAS1 domain-containing protein n=1 Tax=Solitalea longa TaxID=2079460 RepID=A0A2S5A795_9SPHI|nr:fasciclin domain-containing protein [Solitalea longa]POY38470.1 hypothetical protein C3K47_03495 [Solitalea longa]